MHTAFQGALRVCQLWSAFRQQRDGLAVREWHCNKTELCFMSLCFRLPVKANEYTVKAA